MHLMVYHRRHQQVAVVRILQSQLHRANGRNRRSHNTAIVVDIGRLGNEKSSARGKLRRNWATLNRVCTR